jgi:hypothetical protein
MESAPAHSLGTRAPRCLGRYPPLATARLAPLARLGDYASAPAVCGPLSLRDAGRRDNRSRRGDVEGPGGPLAVPAGVAVPPPGGDPYVELVLDAGGQDGRPRPEVAAGPARSEPEANLRRPARRFAPPVEAGLRRDLHRAGPPGAGKPNPGPEPTFSHGDAPRRVAKPGKDQRAGAPLGTRQLRPPEGISLPACLRSPCRRMALGGPSPCAFTGDGAMASKASNMAAGR